MQLSNRQCAIVFNWELRMKSGRKTDKKSGLRFHQPVLEFLVNISGNIYAYRKHPQFEESAFVA